MAGDVIEVFKSNSCLLNKNAKYRVMFDVAGLAGAVYSSFSIRWGGGEGVPRRGKFAFSFDGNPGDPPALLDLEKNLNSFRYSVNLPYVDVEVSDLPEGGSVYLYMR
jgi:hypothetical protein